VAPLVRLTHGGGRIHHACLLDLSNSPQTLSFSSPILLFLSLLYFFSPSFLLSSPSTGFNVFNMMNYRQRDMELLEPFPSIYSPRRDSRKGLRCDKSSFVGETETKKALFICFV
jgi:hypothetical protein